MMFIASTKIELIVKFAVHIKRTYDNQQMKKTFLVLAALAAICINAHAQGLDASPKVLDILSRLTLEEKINLCHGTLGGFSGGAGAFSGVERLGIPLVLCTDGGRGPNATIGTTAFPTGLNQGATWNTEIIEKAGEVMGEETRALGRAVLLGPACNILRDPLGGRFFEYFTEDPYLNSEITVAVTKGIQSQGVAACAKSYACYNRERNRDFYMSVVDDRTMHEIYLPVFKAAVQKADLMTIMTAANGMNFDFVCDSRKMMTDILKDRWGFKGFSMTDWNQARSLEKTSFAGLEVSMPGGDNCNFGAPLLEAVKKGRVSEREIDEKVVRILGIYERLGYLDPSADRVGDARYNTPEHHEVAYETAKESIVLLKNQNKVLPWSNKVRKVLVTGPNADKRFNTLGMGGSSWVESTYETTVLKGLRDALGEANVTYISSDDLGGFTSIPTECLKPVDGVPGFQARHFVKGKDAPAVARTEKKVEFMWEMKSPDPSILVGDWRCSQFEAEIMPPVDGKYTFKFTANGGQAWVFDGFFGGAPMAIADAGRGTGTVTASVDLKKGVPFHLCVTYNKMIGDAALEILWETPQSSASDAKLAKLDRAARKADAVVFVGGLDHNLDTEGRDRVSLDFPAAQQTLINRLSALNKNFTVVLLNGSPVELGGWIDKVGSVVEAFYPGMEGGRAVADVLTGKVNPSGRLPFTWPKKYEDTPIHKLAWEDNDIVLFSDSLMVGYRYYDTRNVEPQFAFGHGLSYTTFEYSGLTATKTSEGKVKVNVTVTNTGKMDGKEVVQLYVKPLNPTVFRPVHELKAFSKVAIKAGESKDVEFILDGDAFSYYDVTIADWKVDHCRYEIEIAKDSRTIVQSTGIEL